MRPGTKLQARMWVTRTQPGEAPDEALEVDLQLDLDGVYTQAEPDIGLPAGVEDIRAQTQDGEPVNLTPQEMTQATEALLRNGGS